MAIVNGFVCILVKTFSFWIKNIAFFVSLVVSVFTLEKQFKAGLGLSFQF
jgi:hypothetical protein